MRKRKEPFHFQKGGDAKANKWVPKKLTKGLKRHLAKVRRRNPSEAERQESLIRG